MQRFRWQLPYVVTICFCVYFFEWHYTQDEHKHWTRTTNTNIGHARRKQTLGTHDEHKHWARTTNTNIWHARRTQTLGTHDEHKHWARKTNTNIGHARRTQTLGTYDEHKQHKQRTQHDMCWTPLYNTFFWWLHFTSIVNISNINLKKRYWSNVNTSFLWNKTMQRFRWQLPYVVTICFCVYFFEWHYLNLLIDITNNWMSVMSCWYVLLV
jgi:hypothetical protein